MSTDFSEVPVLDYQLLSSTETRSQFIDQLRHALINVGFLYLANPPVSPELITRVEDYIPKLFDELSQVQKDEIAMVNSPHFLGYSRLGTERTKEKVDMREQYDFASEYQCPWKEGEPEYLRLWGPAQWPQEEVLPGFKATFINYIAQVEQLSYEFIRLLSEALGLGPQGMDGFYQSPDGIQQRGKIVKYPSLDHDSVSSDQGVGPHYDAGFLTFLLQASPHTGLQVQNFSGAWIDVPPIPNTFVINIGKALDTVTQGLARATSHRVLSPARGSTPRYSVPFFQNIAAQVRLSDVHLNFPEEILALKSARGQAGASDSVNFSEFALGEPSSHVNLIGRVKSHPEVAERHYPEIFKKYFPDGVASAVSVY